MAEQTKVAISSDFLTAFARLPRQTQGKVTEFINKFRNDPTAPGINYEKIKNCADPKICSVRIDDTYRGIVVREKGSGLYILLWVDHHDEAYAWAEKKRCDVNSYTGSVQVYDVQETEPVEEATAKQSAHPLFENLSDAELLTLAVPEAQLPFVRSIISEKDFRAAQSSLPADAFEYLSWIVADFPYNEVLELVQENAPQTSKPDNLTDALETPESQKSFIIVEGEDELHRIMSEPLEKWRVFLHPTQRKIAYRNYSGPAKVTGGAGTGKTVVAMHRAKYLASHAKSQDKILYTTYTANLAADTRDNLRKICSLDELRKIEVINLDAWISKFFHDSGFTAEIAYGDTIDKLWEDAVTLSATDLPYSADFYEEEWDRVVIAQEALSLEKYIKANRNGRGTRLDRKKRIAIWEVLETYQNLMKERQIRDINTAMYECKGLILKSGVKEKYSSIIVDEGQDFSDNAYRLLRALAGEEHENDIFIVGDSHQRIYKNKPVLSKCGINVRGRSSVLKINYRTTEELRKYAFAILEGISFDDLDDDVDLGDKCQSLTHGSLPVVLNFKTANEEFDYVLSEIQSLQDKGVSLSDICVVARTKKLLDDYASLFTKSGIRTFAIKRNKADDRGLEGLRIATMHRVKGLEFQYVFIVAVNDGIIPLPSAIRKTDAVSEKESIDSEKCLLYVAVTRAQKGAFITSYGKPSKFLTGK